MISEARKAHSAVHVLLWRRDSCMLHAPGFLARAVCKIATLPRIRPSASCNLEPACDSLLVPNYLACRPCNPVCAFGVSKKRLHTRPHQSRNQKIFLEWIFILSNQVFRIWVCNKKRILGCCVVEWHAIPSVGWKSVLDSLPIPLLPCTWDFSQQFPFVLTELYKIWDCASSIGL